MDDTVIFGIPTWFIGILGFISLIYLLLWLIQPALTLTKATPAHPASFTFIDPHGPPGALIPFPSIEDRPTLYISLIVPAYNEENRLGKMLETTLRQGNEREKKKKSF